LESFRELVWDYYRDHGRDLPWRHDPTPYQVVVSEIMLQQTQVGRVKEKYAEWLRLFPGWESLAVASTTEVLAAWQGMGYNRRALWLKRIAETVTQDYAAQLPQDPMELMKLSGIGPNTAGSIVAFAFNVPTVFIETNIRRVFIHHFFGDAHDVADKQLLPLIESALDREHPGQWYYALMDYGSYLAKTVPNPNRRSKHHSVQSQFEGSDRQVRGQILRYLLQHRTGNVFDIATTLHEPAGRVQELLNQLSRERFIHQNEGSNSAYRLLD
jgi:A/G-specific adenine glycosylase